MTRTFHPRPRLRRAIPNAAVDLPFPFPVLTITNDGTRRRSEAIGDSVGGASGSSGTGPVKQVTGLHSSAARIVAVMARTSLLRRELGRYFAAQQFLTRLPVPRTTPHAPGDLAASLKWFSVVGVLVGGAVAAVAVALRDAVTPTFAAIMAIAMGAALTGAFHEDGFADTCDAFGGYTVERRREIMRDSRVGTFGALGLIVLFSAKVSALATVVTAGSNWRIVAVALCAHSASRAATVVAIRVLPPVDDPTSKTKPYRATWPGVGFALAIPAVPLAVWALGWDATLAAGAIVLVIEGSRWFFRRFTGGVNGDGLGAINQIAEVVVWAVAARRAVGR